ncbi:MAG: TlpA family protein disulfide reductase [Flavobacterium sp.]|nr:MAG: TlpA family protein disulfide reductase [Flavobacterium sp.]
MAFILAQYGLDSLGVVARNKTMKEKNGNISADEMADVYLKAFVKKLSREERKSWTEKIYGNPDLRNEALYKASASYRTWLTNFIDHVDKSKYKSTSEGYVPASILKLRMVLEEIPVGFIRDELDYRYTTAVFNMVKDTVAKEKVYREFMARSKSTQHLEQLQNDYDNYKMMTSNAVSPDFSYGDVDGKMVTLSSLRGKYVYIDVWATWCVPCKAEIPSLQKVEHDYNAKNIVFVSLSVDYLKDEDTWRKYVKQNKLSGIQVRADKDFKSDFIKKYNINSIPRFILLNPEGKILSGDAYRPSDVKLRAQLDRLLD